MPSGRNALVGIDGSAVDEPLAERSGDDRAEAETGDGDAGDEARLVGEPLLQHGDRHDVGHAEAEPAEDAVAEDEQPELVLVGERRRGSRRGCR